MQKHIFPAGKVRVESAAEFQQRGHSFGVNPDLTGSRLENSGNQLQQRAFAAAVLTNYADAPSLSDRQSDFIQSKDFLTELCFLFGGYFLNYLRGMRRELIPQAV